MQLKQPQQKDQRHLDDRTSCQRRRRQYHVGETQLESQLMNIANKAVIFYTSQSGFHNAEHMKLYLHSYSRSSSNDFVVVELMLHLIIDSSAQYNSSVAHYNSIA